jgi:hypothetical protein
LAALDVLRQQAFAARQPELLARVYPAGPLLQQDTALLVRAVKPGCGLRGVHTTYSAVRVADSAPAHPVIVASAQLAPSQLVCAGRSSGTVAGQGPTTLRIGLIVAGDGYRIASQRPL